MIAGRRVVVVMPAYNAERTLVRTWQEVAAHDVVDLIIVVDDASRDGTVALARGLDKVVVHTHPVNQGYAANQKTCYRLALEHGADIVIMIHSNDFAFDHEVLAQTAWLGYAIGEVSCPTSYAADASSISFAAAWSTASAAWPRT
jgi:glycosyltransferase involved in cell wall biosynthesis